MVEVSITHRPAEAGFVSRLSYESLAKKYTATLSLGLLFPTSELRTTTLGTKHSDRVELSVLWLS